MDIEENPVHSAISLAALGYFPDNLPTMRLLKTIIVLIALFKNNYFVSKCFEEEGFLNPNYRHWK